MTNPVIGILGFSGFIGKTLLNDFLQDHEVICIDYKNPIISDLKKVNVIINLTGYSINNPWSKRNKNLFWESRIGVINKFYSLIEKHSITNIEYWINASAIGIYSSFTNEDEYNYIRSSSYLCNLVESWEFAALKFEEKGISVSLLRFGIVLGFKGFLEKYLQFKKLSCILVPGKSQTRFSFISVLEIPLIIRFILSRKLTGPFNICLPESYSYKNINSILRKSNFFLICTIPSLLVKMVFKEQASLFLENSVAFPKRLLDNGYLFRYNDINTLLTI